MVVFIGVFIEALLTFIVLVGVIIFALYKIMTSKKTMSSKERKERFQSIQELEGMANTVDDLIYSMNKSDDLKAKKKRAETILQILNRASNYPEHQQVFNNFDEIYNQVDSMKKVLSVIEYLSRADKHRFKKKDSSEKNALLDALYEIETNNITDEHFLLLGSHNEETGEIISKSQIEERLKELGWER